MRRSDLVYLKKQSFSGVEFILNLENISVKSTGKASDSEAVWSKTLMNNVTAAPRCDHPEFCQNDFIGS